MHDTLSPLLLRFVNILMISDAEERQHLQCHPETNESTKINIQRSCRSYTELGLGGHVGQRSLMYISCFASAQCSDSLWWVVLHQFISAGNFVSTNPLPCMSQVMVGQKENLCET